MIHFSCDRCRRVIDTEEELRYVVRLEVQAAMDCGLDAEVDEDRDHLLELDEILERLDDAQSEAICDEVYQRNRFDLCAGCYREFIKNPLGRERPASLNFSQN